MECPQFYDLCNKERDCKKEFEDSEKPTEQPEVEEEDSMIIPGPSWYLDKDLCDFKFPANNS